MNGRSRPPESNVEDPKRRRLLGVVALGVGGLAAAVVATPIVAFVLSPLLKRRAVQWQPVGPVDDFKFGETVKVTFLDAARLPWAGYAAQSGAWISRDADGRFTALSAYCTHTGCPIHWERGAELFLCPCHGGVFRRDGTVAAGPPPRPLALHRLRVRAGQLELLPASPLDGVVPRERASGEG